MKITESQLRKIVREEILKESIDMQMPGLYVECPICHSPPSSPCASIGKEPIDWDDTSLGTYNDGEPMYRSHFDRIKKEKYETRDPYPSATRRT